MTSHPHSDIVCYGDGISCQYCCCVCGEYMCCDISTPGVPLHPYPQVGGEATVAELVWTLHALRRFI